MSFRIVPYRFLLESKAQAVVYNRKAKSKNLQRGLCK